MFQIWNVQPNGPIYTRSGNGANWNGNNGSCVWKKIYDTSNKPTPSEIGAIATNNISNQDLVGSDTTPGMNNAICWTYQ